MKSSSGHEGYPRIFRLEVDTPEDAANIQAALKFADAMGKALREKERFDSRRYLIMFRIDTDDNVTVELVPDHR